MKTEMQPRELVEIFAANVKSRRKSLGITQAQLAKRLDVHTPYISDLENGKKTPFLGNIARIAEALEMQPDELLSVSDEIPS